MTTRELREICQKGSSEPFLISKYLYRPFTVFVTRFYIQLGVSSNTVTFHSLVAGLIAAAFALSVSPWALLGVAFFVQLYFILDHVDGELARYRIHIGKQMPSLAGEFFDLWTHLHTYNLAFAAVGISLYRQTGNLFWPILGLIACNICGSYQRMTLASVLVGALARGRIDARDPRYAGVLSVSHGGSDEAPDKRAALKRFFQLGAELVIFPGNILGLTAACLGDFALHWTAFPPVLFRTIYLVAYCTAGIASKIYRTRKTITELQAAAKPPNDEF